MTQIFLRAAPKCNFGATEEIRRSKLGLLVVAQKSMLFA